MGKCQSISDFLNAHESGEFDRRFQEIEVAEPDSRWQTLTKLIARIGTEKELTQEGFYSVNGDTNLVEDL